MQPIKKKKSPPVPVKNSPNASAKMSLFDQLEFRISKHEKKIIYFLLFFASTFSLLLFNSRMSSAGDDSSYIERAWNFLHEGKFPFLQGPGYPLFLSIFLYVFGLNIIALKLTSVFCQAGFIWISYKTFRKRISFPVLITFLSFISFNAFILYYSSQTFTETFFLFIQSICIYLTFILIDKSTASSDSFISLRENIFTWILFGLSFLLLYISKSIAFVCLPAALLYFIITKNYRQAFWALLAFSVCWIIYQVVITAVFGPPDTGQLEMMLRKDFYKPENGEEDFPGMMIRYFSNFNTYIGLHAYRILNLRSTFFKEEDIHPFPGISIVSGLIFLASTIWNYRRNKFIFFSGVYAIVLCSGIFFGIQAANMQDRLIIIAIPFIFLVLFHTVYELLRQKPGLQAGFVLLSLIMLCVTVGKSAGKAMDNFKALEKNLSGDIYYGYTPDWRNFLEMSRYCADSLPVNAVVLSRKPSDSFLYGRGKKFEGQFIINTRDPDSVLMSWQKRKIQYVIIASLRVNPSKNDGLVINTIHQMIKPVAQKYPEKLKLIKTFGDEEHCTLWEISY